MRKTIPVTPAPATPGGKATPDSGTSVAGTAAPPASPLAQMTTDHPAQAGIALSSATQDNEGGGAIDPGTAAIPNTAPNTAPKHAGKVPPSEILDVEIKDKKQLQGIYMPFLTNGGVFLPTAKEYALGDEVYVNLHLLKEPRQYAAIGRVAWITPRNALNKRIQGVGIHFSLDENTGITKRKIEELLGAAVKSDKSTHTL